MAPSCVKRALSHARVSREGRERETDRETEREREREWQSCKPDLSPELGPGWKGGGGEYGDLGH